MTTHSSLVTQPQPRALFCPILADHRDRSVAEAAARGRFSHVGTSLDLGLPPDWTGAALPTDFEWEIEWRKFYYAIDLASAWRETADARFLDAFEILVGSFLGAGDASRDSTDVAARRVQSWLYAWQIFAEDPRFPGLRGDTAVRLLAAIEQTVAYIATHLTPERNHRTLELTTLVLAPLAFPALDPDGDLLRFAFSALAKNVCVDLLDDGVQAELSTHYHATVLRNLITVWENARLHGHAIPAVITSAIERACEVVLHLTAPDGQMPALSDADVGGHAALLELAADRFGREDFRFAATEGTRGKPPSQCNASFPTSGLHVQRSGWGEEGRLDRDARFLVFDCGPIGVGGHGHYDALSIFVAAGGRPLLVDPGRFTYHEGSPNWRRWFKSTAAHNTLCVDGRDQTPYRRGKPQAGAATTRFLGRRSGPGLDVLEGEVESPEYDARHRRVVLFVGGNWWLIIDHAVAPTSHRYDLNFHLGPDARGRTRITKQPTGHRVDAPGVTLALLGDGRPSLRQGFVSERYGVREEAPVLCVATRRRRSACFLTAVLPDAPERSAPLRVSSARVGSAAICVEIAGTGDDGRARDILVWRDAPGRFALGSFVCTGLGGWLRVGEDGAPLAGCGVLVSAVHASPASRTPRRFASPAPSLPLIGLLRESGQEIGS